MYEIYDYTAQRVVAESLDKESLIISAKRRKHKVCVRQKYSNYIFFVNEASKKVKGD